MVEALAATVAKHRAGTGARPPLTPSNVVALVAFAVLPGAFAALFLSRFPETGAFAFDFRGTVWEPTRALLEGSTPFPPPTPDSFELGNPAVYPPSVALVGLPFALLPFGLAAALWIAALTACTLGALWVLGVRDWRCYGIAISALPVLWALGFANLTPVLVFAVALAWSRRDRPLVAGAAVGMAVALKLFLWPLALWLLATRRYRGAIAAAVTATAAVLVPWAAIGFAGLRQYPALLSAANDAFASHGNSVFAGGLGLGLGVGGARALALGVGGVVLALAVVAARRAQGDWRAFAAALTAALVLTPILWLHYFALLLVLVAVARPRAAAVWAVFPAFLVATVVAPPPTGPACCAPAGVPELVWSGLHAAPPVWTTLAYWTIAAVAIAAAVVSPPRRAGAMR